MFANTPPDTILIQQSTWLSLSDLSFFTSYTLYVHNILQMVGALLCNTLHVAAI